MSDWMNTFAVSDNGGDCLFSLLPEMDLDPNTIRRRRYVRFFNINCISTYWSLKLTLTILLNPHSQCTGLTWSSLNPVRGLEMRNRRRTWKTLQITLGRSHWPTKEQSESTISTFMTWTWWETLFNFIIVERLSSFLHNISLCLGNDVGNQILRVLIFCCHLSYFLSPELCTKQNIFLEK